MKIVNLTPHNLNLIRMDGTVREVEPSGLARVACSRVQAGEVDGIPLFETIFGEVTGLPDVQEGTIFVVSAVVAGHPSVRERTDIWSPGELIRSPDGQPIGAKGISRSA